MGHDMVEDYLERRGVKGPWSLDLPGEDLFSGAIIIPALAESDYIPGLIESLEADRTLPQSGMVVVFVVNNREDASSGEKQDNLAAISYLRKARQKLHFPVAIVDASSEGLSLPARDGGVGLGRKLGHDLILQRLDFSCRDPLLISLDADTWVEPGYAGAVIEHFKESTSGGAAIPFSHRRAPTAVEQEAIDRYELFLRCYVAGLEYAGSPYAFHTVGSAMACRASAYIRCGGMNRKRAGEDFYFLQSLAKTGGVGKVSGTAVFPSPRRSHRVPFGTGRAIGALLDNEADAVLFYRPQCYFLLREWLSLAAGFCSSRSPYRAEEVVRISPYLHGFLEEQGFQAAWERFLLHNRDEGRLRKAFHDWFDAFRTMKFFHFLSDGPHPRGAAEDVACSWPSVWGEQDMSIPERLHYLRICQGVNPKAECC